MSIITVDKVSFGYDINQPILQSISFDVKKIESIGIIGANGVGKSTLLKLLVGLNLTYTGVIQIDNLPVNKAYLTQIRQKIGYVFQDSDSQLFMTTVGEDVAFAPRNYGLSADEVEYNVTQALEKTRIVHLREKPIYKLSGGEKKLVSIATILSMIPDILLLDEPTVGLDPKNRRNLIHILQELNQVKLIASHDLDFILDTCSRTILMADGKIVKDGKTKEVLTNQVLLEENGLELPLSLYRTEQKVRG